MLVKGKIPAHTVCPYRKECIKAKETVLILHELTEEEEKAFCQHKGINHPTEFSCATARSIKIMLRNLEALQSQHPC